ncbi:MAG: hypothetical protein O3B82_00800 [Bacteroidetes bacterium]|nr:hypothetical protein [Bacteroidota bacterium]
MTLNTIPNQSSLKVLLLRPSLSLKLPNQRWLSDKPSNPINEGFEIDQEH